jgi:hypothetical protein
MLIKESSEKKVGLKPEQPKQTSRHAVAAEEPSPAPAFFARPQRPKPTEVTPEQPEVASASEASELFFAWWPSSYFPNPGWPDVEQNLKCAHRILTTNGFLIVADPENVAGDGKSWVLECKPSIKLPKDADPADLARQCLESEGLRVDAVVQLDESDRTLHVALSPPPQSITSVEVREEPWTKRRTKLLQTIHGVDIARLSTISSVAITKEWMDAHEGANPPMEYVIRETMKRTGQALSVTPTPPPQPEEQHPMCKAAVCVDGSELLSPTLKTPRAKSDRLLSSYRSEIKRAILAQLALKPKATDVEICRGLDGDGSVELPTSWKSKASDRGFFDAYSDAARRHKVEVTIGKVRKDLRKQGLLD